MVCRIVAVSAQTNNSNDISREYRDHCWIVLTFILIFRQLNRKNFFRKILNLRRLNSFAPAFVTARNTQLDRYRKHRLFSNSQIPAKLMKQYCKLDDSCLQLMEKAIRKFHLSARAYHRILKVSRTIADLDNSSDIKTQYLSEAIQYRSIDQY